MFSYLPYRIAFLYLVGRFRKKHKANILKSQLHFHPKLSGSWMRKSVAPAFTSLEQAVILFLSFWSGSWRVRNMATWEKGPDQLNAWNEWAHGEDYKDGWVRRLEGRTQPGAKGISSELSLPGFSLTRNLSPDLLVYCLITQLSFSINYQFLHAFFPKQMLISPLCISHSGVEP